MAEMADTLTKAEKALRDRFVDEYVKDYDAFCAALRIGYAEAFAAQYSQQFLREPYTQQRLSKVQEEIGETNEDTQHKKRIIAGLYRLANERGMGSSHGGRVAAYNTLVKVLGLEAPVKSVVEVTEKPAVTFYVPDNGRK